MTTDNKTQSKPEKRKCKKCGSTLRAIGKDRANGKPGRKGVFSDWPVMRKHSLLKSARPIVSSALSLSSNSSFSGRCRHRCRCRLGVGQRWRVINAAGAAG